MAFEDADYLSWYVPRVRGAHDAINLHSSGVPPLDFDGLTPTGGNAWALAPAFEEALASWLGHPCAELVYVPGATGGTLLALLTFARPGAGFLVEEPIYEPMRRQAERLGPVARLPRSAANRWELDLETAARQITDETAAVLITEPHNPSGVFAPREQVLALAELAARRGAILLINEVYRGWSDRPSYHGTAENVVVVSSLSKLFGAYAARLGWLSGSPDRVQRLRTGLLNYSMPAAPSAGLGLAMLERADDLVAEARRRAALVEPVDAWVRETPGVSWWRPDGAGYGCVALPEGIDDHAFVERLQTERGVLVIPGSLWEVPGSLRLSWLQTDRPDLERGLEQLASALAEEQRG